MPALKERKWRMHQQIFSGVVFAKYYRSTYRITRYVHIYWRHKHANLQTLFIKKLLFKNFFNYHNFTIYGRNNMAIVYNCFTFWISEKLKNKC